MRTTYSNRIYQGIIVALIRPILTYEYCTQKRFTEEVAATDKIEICSFLCPVTQCAAVNLNEPRFVCCAITINE